MVKRAGWIAALVLAGCFVDAGGATRGTGSATTGPASVGASGAPSTTTSSAPSTSTGSTGTGGGATTSAPSTSGLESTTTGAATTMAATTMAATTGPGRYCGDGVLSPELGEECDDGDDNGFACCSDRCVEEPDNLRVVEGGRRFTCIASCAGQVRCWGEGDDGALGGGDQQSWGDQEGETLLNAAVLEFVGNQNQPLRVTGLAAGDRFACALLESGVVRCWGRNNNGQLGYANSQELYTPGGDVSLGGLATKISAYFDSTCALLEGGAVRCWGNGSEGALGSGSTNHVGNNELPSSIPPVSLGQPAVDIAVGRRFACAALADGTARCWGRAEEGQLGLGMGNVKIGDDELPDSVDALEFSSGVTRVWAGETHACALLESGALHCWGDNEFGGLGLGSTVTVGLNERADAAATEVFVGELTDFVAGRGIGCGVLGPQRRLHCWGGAPNGTLGHGELDNLCFSNNNTVFSCDNNNNPKCCLADAPDEQVGVEPFNIVASMRAVTAGENHVCALTSFQELHCWGNQTDGRLLGGQLPLACAFADGPLCLRHPQCCLGDDELANVAATLIPY